MTEGRTSLPLQGGALPPSATDLSHLRGVGEWLLLSERPGGGSSAFYSPLVGWARPYPETTGYLIPTLLALRARGGEAELEALALRCGWWLKSIRNRHGSWNAGLHPPLLRRRASVFNTGQVLKGMMALWRWTGEEEWLEYARQGAEWTLSGLVPGGLWRGRDYRGRGTPSYYTEVLSTLIDVAQQSGDEAGVELAREGLDRITSRIRENGAVEGWGFGRREKAFTHTIAYTISGIQEGARLLGDPELQEVVTPTVRRLLQEAEASGGRLPGAFDQEWRGDHGFICLTGNAQVALIFLGEASRTGDGRLSDAAVDLLEVVQSAQSLDSRRPGVRGGIPGSLPLTGSYMRFRYPNWAAKFFADALLALSACGGGDSPEGAGPREDGE
jgi:hypothetical protein